MQQATPSIRRVSNNNKREEKNKNKIDTLAAMSVKFFQKKKNRSFTVFSFHSLSVTDNQEKGNPK